MMLCVVTFTGRSQDLYTALQKFNFKREHIEEAMKSSVLYGGDLHSALDWLCLNLKDGNRGYETTGLAPENTIILVTLCVHQRSCQKASASRCRRRARRADPGSSLLRRRNPPPSSPKLPAVPAKTPPRCVCVCGGGLSVCAAVHLSVVF